MTKTQKERTNERSKQRNKEGKRLRNPTKKERKKETCNKFLMRKKFQAENKESVRK